MFDILLDNTFQTSSPFIDTAINELLSSETARSTHSRFACFSCSTVSVIAIDSLLQGIITLHNLPGSSLDCLLATSQVTFRSAGIWESKSCFDYNMLIQLSFFHNNLSILMNVNGCAH